MPTREEVYEALRQVEDPELGMDIVELGLLYDVEVRGPRVKVTHSLTSMGCPAGPMIQEDISRVAREIPGVEDVDIELTWDPPWSPERMSDDAKFLLGIAEAIDQSQQWGWLKGGAGVYHSTRAHGPYLHIDARGYVTRWGL